MAGLTITSTQDTKIQNQIETEMEKSKYVLQSKTGGDPSQAAMVIIDHKTGYVLGCVGGLGEKTTPRSLNRATQSIRQTGSAIKPIAVVGPAIQKRIITASSIYDDTEKDFPGGYHPVDYSKALGKITVRRAIESSQNIPFVEIMQELKPSVSMDYLERLGITTLTEEDNNLSLALGGVQKGISPLEMAAAYAAIANDGQYIEPVFYQNIKNHSGETIITAKQDTRRVFSKETAFILKDLLTQPVEGSNGTATYCKINGIDVAAKTGTTDSNYDRWLCGFTPYYTAATWYGFDNNETVRGWSLSPATQIWSSVMKQVHSGLDGKTFAEARPDNVVTATVCRDSGLLVTDACKHDPRGNRGYTEYFVKGTVPTKTCDCHVEVEICEESELLATEFCPKKETKVFITRPNSDTDTAWKSAADAKYMLTIKDECKIHTEEADKVKPEIKLNGSSNITIELNDTFIDPGATATDNKDGDLTNKIKVSGTVNTSKAGTYTITYTVQDSAGNKAMVTRIVTVKGSGTSPGDDDDDDENTTGNENENNVIEDENNVVDNTTT